MFKSLKLKLLTFFFIANVVILVSFSILIFNIAKKGVIDNTDTIMKIISFDVMAELKKESSLEVKKMVLELIDEFKISPLEIKIIYYDKKTFKIISQTISSSKAQEIFDVPFIIQKHLDNIYYFDKNEYRISSMQVLEDKKNIIIFQLAIKKNINSLYLKQLFLGLLIGIPILIIILLFIANLLIDRTLFFVKNVISSVKMIGINNLSKRIETDKIPSEIEELVQTFNHLLDILEDSFTRISSFSSDASHELKTPLTIMRGEIEVTLRKERDAKEYKIVLNGLLQETIQIQEIIDQLLFITKNGSSEYLENYEEIYLDELLLDMVEQNKNLAIQKMITLNINNIIPVTIYVNETLFKIAINNIIRNAILYNYKNSKVNIYMKEDKDTYFLYIEDFGYGISQNDMSSIFNRFYRVNDIRSHQNSGTGLGLSIVKMVLDIHQFSIDLVSRLNKGTVVIIKIPK